jgi:hypothetical protein
MPLGHQTFGEETSENHYLPLRVYQLLKALKGVIVWWECYCVCDGEASFIFVHERLQVRQIA